MQQQQRQQAIEAPPQPSLEELVRQMTIQNMQFQQETRAPFRVRQIKWGIWLLS